MGNILTWRQKLVLRAASDVDYLPFRALQQTTALNGVYRSLVIRGYLQPHRYGWEITQTGREESKWWTERKINQLQKEEAQRERRKQDAEGRYESSRRNAG